MISELGNELSFQISESDLHSHLRARMEQRGVAPEEIERTLNEGWIAMDAKPGTLGKTLVFSYEREWEGNFYLEKEIAVYYKVIDNAVILLTVKTRYGQGFPRR